MKTNDNTSHAQRKRLRDWLFTKGKISTVEARHQLDILGVAPRVYELRHNENLNIQTHWIYAKNPGGSQHKIANYVLQPGKWQEICNDK